MIPARRSKPFLAFFTAHARGRIARTFEALRVRGLDTVRERLAAGPVLIVSNHTSWWDPLLALHLSASARALGAEAYAMMDARNLRALPFFGWVGAFGVDLDDPRDGARGIRYAARLLARPGVLVWIFAQGEERPVTAPLVFRGGSAEVAKVARAAAVIPTAIRYEFGATERPTAFVSFGEALVGEGDRAARRLAQERAVARELERIEAAVRGDADAGFEPAITGRRSRLFAVAQAALAALSRPKLPG